MTKTRHPCGVHTTALGGEIEVKPLTDCADPYGLLRSYEGYGPGRTDRIDGDQRLLIALHEECDGRRSIDGQRPAVRELPEHVLRAIVEKVEDACYGTWRLHGNEDEPIVDRLNEHFRPLQGAWLEFRLKQDEDRARQTAASAELDVQLAAQRNAQERAVWNLPPA